MKSKLSLVFLLIIICGTVNFGQEKSMNNPFLIKWNTPFQTPPFELIKNENYLPAFEEGIKQQKVEVDAIIQNKETPTFDNTIGAMEKSGKLLTKTALVFYGLNNTITNEEMQKINQTVSPMLTKHNDDINLNTKLFERVKYLYDQKDKLNLSPEQKMLLDNYYLDFVRGGVNLNDADKEKFRKINEELSLLGVKFGENILKETNAVGLIIDSRSRSRCRC